MSTPATRHWEPIVRRVRQSGVSVREYARQHGINHNTLAWWCWRLGDKAEDSPFVEVTVADPRRPLRLHLGSVGVEVDRNTDLILLRQVIEALS